jgi:hypothetical protein
MAFCLQSKCSCWSPFKRLRWRGGTQRTRPEATTVWGVKDSATQQLSSEDCWLINLINPKS